MSDTPLLTMTDRALARLRTLGEGNGLAPEAFDLIEKTEQVYTVEGIIRLTPEMSIQPRAYPGPVVQVKTRGKTKQVLPNFASLQEEVERLRKNFAESRDWLPEAVKELKDEPGHGWGHDGGKIVFPDHGAVLAASEKCPACQGNGQRPCEQCRGQTVTPCTVCHGNKLEPCYHCYGKGTDPVYTDQPCTVCHGTRMAPCRTCQGRGFVPCVTCHGRGSTPCPSCKSRGVITQEIDMNASATVRFAVVANANLPSGLLRSLDRAGMANLMKGHGDIEMVEPDLKDSGALNHGIVLRARIPYADMKFRINGKTVIAGAFGKKGLLSGLPAFLDESLKLWRERLAAAAAGKAPLNKALEVRIIREALALTLRGKGTLQEIRRLYPIGLSAAAAKEILDNINRALRRQTLHTRISVAFVSLVGSTGLFTGYFLTPLHGLVAQKISPRLVLLLDAFLPALVMGLSGYALAHMSRWVLKRRYPHADIAVSQSIGRIGYATLAGILVLYGFFLLALKYF